MDTPNSIIPFENGSFGKLRVIVSGGGAWFVASDVARALGYRDANRLTRRLDDDEKGTRSVGTLGGEQRVSVISEAGLYSAVLGSKIPEARAYKRWVTHEVLPAIHRTGGYVAARADEPDDVVMARAVLVARDTIERQRAEIERMRPKALLGEAVEPSKASYTVTEATRYLAQAIGGVRRQDVFDLLRGRHMMVKRGTAPTRKGIDTGRMVAVMHEFETSDGRVLQKQMGRLTGKGLAWLVSQFSGKGAAA